MQPLGRFGGRASDRAGTRDIALDGAEHKEHEEEADDAVPGKRAASTPKPIEHERPRAGIPGWADNPQEKRPEKKATTKPAAKPSYMNKVEQPKLKPSRAVVPVKASQQKAPPSSSIQARGSVPAVAPKKEVKRPGQAQVGPWGPRPGKALTAVGKALSPAQARHEAEKQKTREAFGTIRSNIASSREKFRTESMKEIKDARGNILQGGRAFTKNGVVVAPGLWYRPPGGGYFKCEYVEQRDSKTVALGKVEVGNRIRQGQWFYPDQLKPATFLGEPEARSSKEFFGIET